MGEQFSASLMPTSLTRDALSQIITRALFYRSELQNNPRFDDVAITDGGGVQKELVIPFFFLSQ